MERQVKDDLRGMRYQQSMHQLLHLPMRPRAPISNVAEMVLSSLLPPPSSPFPLPCYLLPSLSMPLSFPPFHRTTLIFSLDEKPSQNGKTSMRSIDYIADIACVVTVPPSLFFSPLPSPLFPLSSPLLPSPLSPLLFPLPFLIFFRFMMFQMAH